MTIIRRLTAVLAVVAVVLVAPVAAQTVPPSDVVDYGAARLAPGPIGDSALRALRQDEEPPLSSMGGSRNYAVPTIATGTGFWLTWESGFWGGFECPAAGQDEPYGPFLGITCSEEDETKSRSVAIAGGVVILISVPFYFARTPVNLTPSLNGIRLSW